MTRIPAFTNTSRIPAPSTCRSKFGYNASTASASASANANASASTSTGQTRPAGKVRLKFESKLKKFDRSVIEELKRRKDANNVLVTATTSDPNLREAVDHLARAQAASVWAGAVHAAEEAAAATATGDSQQIEEAAAQGARNFQTEIIDTIEESIPGSKPIQVLGYVGITRPKHAAH